MSYTPVEVYKKTIRFFGIPVWTCVKTISQEKFYEIVSAKVEKEIDAKFAEIKRNAAGEIMERLDAQLGRTISQRREVK